MCTLTWRRSGGRYEVFFNRDELKTRGRAEPPRLQMEKSVRFLAPRDPDGGGTWMLANEHDLTICLLNRWHEEASAESLPRKSRGLLVWEMGVVENVPAAEEYLRKQDLSALRPFTIVAFDPVGERAWDWDGARLAAVQPSRPMASSSFHFEEVLSARKARFDDLRCCIPAERDLLERYHADAEHGPTAFSVRMCRTDAQTMSRSQVLVGEGRITWHYLEEQPDLIGPPRLYESALGPQTAVDPVAVGSQGRMRQDDGTGGV